MITTTQLSLTLDEINLAAKAMPSASDPTLPLLYTVQVPLFDTTIPLNFERTLVDTGTGEEKWCWFWRGGVVL